MLSALNWQPTHTDGRNCQSHPTVIVSNWPSLREQPEATFDTSWPPQTRQIPQHRDYCETRPCDPACFAVDIIPMSHWLPTMLSIKQGWFASNDIHLTVNPVWVYTRCHAQVQPFLIGIRFMVHNLFLWSIWKLYPNHKNRGLWRYGRLRHSSYHISI